MQELFATQDIRKTFASTKDIPCASFLNDQSDACDLTAITMPCKYITIRLFVNQHAEVEERCTSCSNPKSFRRAQEMRGSAMFTFGTAVAPIFDARERAQDTFRSRDG